MLRDYLLENEIITRAQMYESPLASEELLRLAHTEHNIKAMKTGNIDLPLELVF